MAVNVGTIDRILRACLGLALLYLAFMSGLPLFATGAVKYGSVLVGVVMLVVASTRICPIYSLLGFHTCRR